MDRTITDAFGFPLRAAEQLLADGSLLAAVESAIGPLEVP